MIRNVFGKVAAGAVSLAVLAFAGQAEAGWRWHGSSGGSSGSWGSSGGSSGSWGSSGGSSGSWGSSGGSSSSGSSSSSGGSSGGYYYAPAVEAAPVDPSGAVPMTPATPAAPAPGETSIQRTDGLLSVNVPEDAKIFVNGTATSSTGAERQYVSRDLTGGYNYSYEVRAEVVRDGKTVEQVKTVNLRAGETAQVAFDFPAEETAPTSLTVHVPADAKVYLSGNATKATGETRIFRTTGLTTGKAWDNYTVKVEVERGGRLVVQEKTITLTGGETQELSFDFETDKVASAK
jgi:uncharacterized protein (TIGR03000 family)